MARYYEWTLHNLDEDGDIIDHIFSEDLGWYLKSYASELKEALAGSPVWQLELWRNDGDDVEGMTDRWYGYYDAADGLAPEFDIEALGDRNSGGPKIPKRFFVEIAKMKKHFGLA